MAHLGSAARQVNPVTVNIRCQFRGRPLQDHFDIVNDGTEMFMQSVIHKSRGDFPLHGKPGDNISPVYNGAFAFLLQVPQGYFNVLGRFAADDQAELFSYGRPDGLVKFFAAHVDQMA